MTKRLSWDRSEPSLQNALTVLKRGSTATDAVEDRALDPLARGRPTAFPSTEFKPQRAWVEGSVIITEENKTAVDFLEQYAKELGLNVFRRDADKDDGYRKWTDKRVPLLAVATFIADHPGCKIEDIRELYKVEPWNSAQQYAALVKVRVALHRLRREERVAAIHARSGELCYYIPGAIPNDQA